MLMQKIKTSLKKFRGQLEHNSDFDRNVWITYPLPPMINAHQVQFGFHDKYEQMYHIGQRFGARTPLSPLLVL